MAKSLEDMTLPELVEHTRRVEKDAALVTTLSANPKSRSALLALAKEAMPNTAIPEHDARVEAEKIVAVEREAREKTDAKLLALENRERWREQRETTKTKYSLTDADLLGVEALMMDKDAPIPHYDAAVKVYRASQQMAEPSSHQLTDKTWEMPDKASWGKGVGNKMELDKQFKQAAYQAVNDLRKTA